MRQQNHEMTSKRDVAHLRALEMSTAKSLPNDVAELQCQRTSELLGHLKAGPSRTFSSAAGSRVILFDGERCIATGAVFPAEGSVFSQVTGLDDGVLRGSVGLAEVYVEPERNGDALPLLMYLLLRRARIWDRHTVIAYVDPSLLGTDRDVLQWQPLPNLATLSDQGFSTTLLPVAQRLDIAIHKAQDASGSEGRAFLRQFFVPEAVETLEIHVDRFFRTDFFRAVYDSTLSREQYVYSMSNLHQFVRYTTRLIGRAVGLSDDEDLRNHWLSHLTGEINHEKIIEKDLANLGADVDYVVKHMVPNVHNQEFMVVQESIIGFHQDPVLLMAAPFAAEGWTARLDQRFMQALDKAVCSWGIKNPRHVTSFLSSHIHYDGGDDGHWENTRKVLGRFLENDFMLQKFLNLVHLAMNAFERSYASYVIEQRLWNAIPARNSTNTAIQESVALHESPS